MSLVQDAVTEARALHALLNARHRGQEGARMQGFDGRERSGAKAAGAWTETAAAGYNTGSAGTPAPVERDHKTGPSGYAGQTGKTNGRSGKESRPKTSKTPKPVAPAGRADTAAPAVASDQPTEATSIAAGIDWSVISVSAAQAATPAPPPGLPLSPKIDWSTRKRDRKCATASSGSQSEEASGWSVRPSEHPGQMLWYNVSTGEVDWVSVS